ncbi:MAG: hypothetical protein Q9165_002386 [Trypethelium subeluteriae]
MDSYGHTIAECLSSLDYDGLDSWQVKTADPYPGTFDWILPANVEIDPDFEISSGQIRDPRNKRAASRKASDEFLAWLRDGNGIFWITGIAGSGKSTIMKHIANSNYVKKFLLTANTNAHPIVAVHFFYRDSSGGLTTSKEGLLRSLLYQILDQAPMDVIELAWRRRKNLLVDQKFEKSQDSRNRAQELKDLALQLWDIKTLTQLFKRVVSESSKYRRGFTARGEAHWHQCRLILFVDGLDEYSGEDLDLADFFENIARIEGTHVQLCLASRDHPDFTAAFDQCPGFRMENETEEDLKFYTNERLKEAIEGGGTGFQDLPDTVLRHSNKMFLRAREACDLAQHTWRSKRAETPAKLKEDIEHEIMVGSSQSEEHCAARLCQRILDDMASKQKDEAELLILLIVRYLDGPLPMKELAIIIDSLSEHPTLLDEILPDYIENISSSSENSDNESDSDEDDSDSDESSRRQAIRPNMNLEPDLEQGLLNGMKILLQPCFEEPTCLIQRVSYLRQRIQAICGGLVTIDKDNVLPLYSSLNNHLENSIIKPGGRTAEFPYLGDQQLFKASLYCFATLYRVKRDYLPHIRTFPFSKYAASFYRQHWQIAESRLQCSQYHIVRQATVKFDGLEKDIWDRFWQWTNAETHMDRDILAPQNFLEYTASMNLPYSFEEVLQQYQSEPLRAQNYNSSFSQSRTSFQIFDVNMHRGSLLYHVARGGSCEMLTSLVEMDVRVSDKLRYARAAFNCCIYHGHLALAEQLIRSNLADVNSRNPCFEYKRGLLKYPLAIAIDQPHKVSTTKFLLEHGADPNVMGRFHIPILMKAVAIEDEDSAYQITRDLIGAGAKIDKDMSLRSEESALSTAISRSRGAPRLTELLLSSGADPNYSPTTRWTPLSVALSGWRQKKQCRALVACLLEHGARPTPSDLHSARESRDKKLIRLVEDAFEKFETLDD